MGQQATWLDFLGEFDFEIAYRPGARNRNTCTLCRRSWRTCVFYRGGVDFENLETRATEVVETPAVVGPMKATGAWSPSGLVSARAIDTKLVVVYEWHVDSEDPLPWCDVRYHSEATKEYWAQ